MKRGIKPLYVIGILLVVLVGLYLYTNSVEPFAPATPAGYKTVPVSVYLQLDAKHKVIASSSTDPNVKANTGGTSTSTITIAPNYILQNYVVSTYNGTWKLSDIKPTYNNMALYPSSYNRPIATVALPGLSATGKITPKLPITVNGPNNKPIYKAVSPITFTGLLHQKSSTNQTTSTDNGKSKINANIRIDLTMIVPK